MLAAVTISRWARQCLANRRARRRRRAEAEAAAAAAVVRECVQAVVRAVENGTGYHGALDARGRPHGRGKLVDEDGGWYEGQWLHGERHGSGLRTWADGARYEGEWSHGAMRGTGSHISAGGRVRRHGVWSGEPAQLHGEGTMVVELQEEGEVLDYSGQFERGLRHGAGRETRGDDGASVYEGQWQRDLRHGVGTARTTYERYSGEWVAGVRCGTGEHEVIGGYRIEGVWADDDIEHGVVRGRYDGVYEGQLQGLKRHGQGTWRNKGGDVYSGAWKDDHWNGHGTLTTP